MKVAIMQPYFLPYIGYWQLLASSNVFVLYSDVNFIKGGWINRNSVIMNNVLSSINVQMVGASSNKLINEIGIDSNSKWRNKLFRKISQSYANSKNAQIINEIVYEIIFFDGEKLSDYLENSIKVIAAYLEIDTKIINSETLNNSELRSKERVVSICKLINSDIYVNVLSGKSLYDREYFDSNNIELKFIENLKSSTLYKSELDSKASILHILYHYEIKEIQSLIKDYKLVD